MSEITTSVPSVHVSDLEKIIAKVREISGEDTELSFEFIIASLFPTSWKNIQADLNRHYTQGYIQGRIDKEKEMKQYRCSLFSEDDPDCYCE